MQGVGIRADVHFERGNAGPFDIKLGFKPPNGVGLSIDGGGFKGGGFLIFDPDKGEYAGALELTFQGIISVRAVGILATRMPDGGEGFSLIIIIVVGVPADPAELGFHAARGRRPARPEPHRACSTRCSSACATARSTASCSRRDVVANAPRIISDLKRVFPPMEGRFLIGPMGKLGWGTPTLVSLELGILLEIPRPAFAILGVLRVAVPAEEIGDPQPAGQLRRQRRLREGPAPVRRLALRLARPDLPAHRRHGGAHLLEGQSELPADRRRIPSRLHAAADEPRHPGARRDRAVPGQSRTCAPRAISPSHRTRCSSARASSSTPGSTSSTSTASSASTC